MHVMLIQKVKFIEQNYQMYIEHISNLDENGNRSSPEIQKAIQSVLAWPFSKTQIYKESEEILQVEATCR